MKTITSITASDTVIVMVHSEESDYPVEMSKTDQERCAQLLEEAQDGGEYPEEVNEILDRSKKLVVVGHINTMGDGWGWSEGPGGEEG